MNPVLVITTLLESIRLATSLISKLNAGEMTAEQVAAEWDRSSTNFNAAADRWESTRAPN